MEERKDISWELVRNRCVRKKEKKKSRKKNKKWVKWGMWDMCKEIYKNYNYNCVRIQQIITTVEMLNISYVKINFN